MIGIPIVRISDISGGIVSCEKSVKVKPDSEFEAFEVFKDDILIAMSGATTGKFGIYRGNQKAYQNQRVGNFTIFDKTRLQNQFLYYQIHCLKRNIEKDAYGGAQPNISSTKIEAMLIVLPPIEEQERIVAKIEELFSELDAGVESLKKAQAQLKTYRQAVLKSAFEGKLTNENVPDGELPEGWKRVNVIDLVDRISDGPFGSNLKGIDYVQEGVRVIRLENIGVLSFRDELQSFVTEEKYKTIARYTVKGGDIIFSSFIADEIRVTILPDHIHRAINKADCFLLRVNESKIDRKYLVFFLSTKENYNQLVHHVHGATRPRINTTQLKAALVPVCSLSEQQRIVEEIERRLSVCDKLEETIAASLKQSEALRQSILKQAFEGNLVQQVVEPKKRQPNEQFERMKVLAFILQYLGSKGFRPKQMATAKYVYLIEKIYGVPIYNEYRRLHLGPYSPEIKKNIFNKTYFSHTATGIDVLNGDKLFKYPVPNKEIIENAIDEIAATFAKYSPSERSHKVELLATVCKVIEDIGSTEFTVVRQSMREWPIELEGSKFENKAEKFDEPETERCIKFIINKGWDRKLTFVRGDNMSSKT